MKEDLTRRTQRCQNPKCRRHDALDENGLCELCTPEDLRYESHPYQPQKKWVNVGTPGHVDWGNNDLTDCVDE